MIPPGLTVVRVSGPTRASIGEWTTVVASAANFTGSGAMTWTVEPADVTTYAYTLVGKTMIVSFDIDSTTVGGTPGVALQIGVPGGFVAAKTMFVVYRARDNGVDSVGMAQTTAGGAVVYLYKDAPGNNWSASTDNTRVAGSMTFEIR